jgi:integrase
MASVDDRWHVQRKMPDGVTRKERTARYGTGKRWQVRWRDHEGAPRKKSFDRKVDADREASRLETELARGTYIDPRGGEVSFQDYAERLRATQFADPNTAHQVGVRFRRHVYPALGHLAMEVVTPSHIRHWLHGLTMARSYQRTIFANVSQVFTAAVADDLIGRNPCRSRTVRKPVADPRQVMPWAPEQMADVHASLPDRYAILSPLAAGAGLRQGEVFGLAMDDIDFRRRTISVRRQVKLTARNQPYFALPKGRKTRTVPMPNSVRAALLSHLEHFPARLVTLPWDGPTGPLTSVALILTTREDKPVNRHYFNAKIWKPALRANGVPETRDNGCHALRHYYASVLLDGGESIKTVSERLGHSDPGFTLRTYTHLLPDSESRTTDIIDAAFDRFRAPGTRRRAWTPRQPTEAVARLRSTGPTKVRRSPGDFGPQR